MVPPHLPATSRPMYSAERQMHERRAKAKPEATLDALVAMITDMRGEISSLRSDVAALKQPSVATNPLVGEPVTDSSDDAAVVLLKAELHGLAKCIAETKLEIAAIRPSGPAGSDDHITIVANELDAVVAATEDATQSILDSVEAVDTMAQELRSHVSNAYAGGILNDISEKMTAILEACNFQDITGQRITKVVNTLKYVEQRVNAMIAIWGEEAAANDTSSPKEDLREGDARLLNGPQLDGIGISQNDIDAMFG